jgi:hypothetical protein
MKERFPRVEWFTCSPSGVLAPANPIMAVQYDTRYDSKAVAPRAQQYFYQYCPADVNDGALRWSIGRTGSGLGLPVTDVGRLP